MKKTLFLLLVVLTGFSCNSVLHKIFSSNKTPHEQYADQLENRHLKNTPEGRQWLAASRKALVEPQIIQLPYKQNGYFRSDKVQSPGLRFHARQGERLTFALDKKTVSHFILYSDLFSTGNPDAPALFSADTSTSQFSYDIEATGDYILRLQPELFQNGGYSLSVSIGPSLSFPVSYRKAIIGSFWGDERDGGKRKHEGIDIFAPKFSPAIAAADGYITGVKEEGLGGKTIWLKPEGKNYTLYYAHLDKQLVEEGQFAKKGDTLGLVGNTGNAKYTPSHLHFGVYSFGGAVDPLPFVNRTVKTASEAPAKDLAALLKLTKARKEGDSLINANTVLIPLAVTSKNYIVELPNMHTMQIPLDEVK